jgi:hypothetical protein
MSIGVPSALFALNFRAAFWQSKRFDDMNDSFKAVPVRPPTGIQKPLDFGLVSSPAM